MKAFGTPDEALRNLREHYQDLSRSNSSPSDPEWNARLDAGLNLQVVLNAFGQEEESFALSCELMQLAPDDPRILFNHGWHWLKRDQLQKGMALLESGRALSTYGAGPLDTSRPLWMPETGRGQTVIVRMEGGLGDEMIHFRFTRDLVEKWGCRVIVACNPGLAPLFARSPWVSAVIQREAAPGVFHESWLPGMSLALALGYEYKDISNKPYLYPDPKQVQQWNSLLNTPKRLRVALRWAGNPQFEHQQLRGFPLDVLFQLVGHKDVQFYSVQRDDNLVELPPGVIDLGPHLKTWDDTAAALSCMDLTISSCTSVAHASAAMGKKTWVITPALPYFIWAPPGRHSLWYEDVTLFRQEKFGSWDGVKELLAQDFATFAR